MSKIAYVTDLHLCKQTKGRLKNFYKKIQKLPQNLKPKAIIFGGDTFNIEPKYWESFQNNPWDKKIRGKIKIAQEKFARKYFLPQMKKLAKNNPGMEIFLSPGNVDYDAYDYIEAHRELFPMVQCIEGKVVSYGEFSLFGVGGVTIPSKSGFYKMAESDYRGFIRGGKKGKWFRKRMAQAGMIKDWNKVIFVTHLPAYREVDCYYDGKMNKIAHAGKTYILAFIKNKHPLLHLTGHAHMAPKYNKGKIYSIIEGHTISINPGGIHDPESQAVLIDLDGLLLYHEGLGGITAKGAQKVIAPLGAHKESKKC